jgi:hypothetical protein
VLGLGVVVLVGYASGAAVAALAWSGSAALVALGAPVLLLTLPLARGGGR